MSTSTRPDTSTSAVDGLDLDLTLASIGLGVARALFLRCGSAGNARLLEEAVADVDRLLDERLARVPG